MIIVKLQGGLGNQLFQYAFGRRLALQRNTELCFDISVYHNDLKRHYSLPVFAIRARTATQDEIRRLQFPHGFVSKIAFVLRKKIIRQFNEGFDNKLLSLPNNSYLDGFFQSEKCFENIADTIRQELTLSVPLTHSAMNVKTKIEQALCPVSVHIRRGDYVATPDMKKYYVSLDSAYYVRAAHYISNTNSTTPTFFVFSDDIEWAKKNIHLGFPTEFVSSAEIRERDYEELFLMSLCHHHIIANSTFSWWGAWLNPRTDKIVVAPKKWFIKKKKHEQDIVPATWIRL